MSELRDSALRYAALGWRVHPLRPRDKRPLLSDWPTKATTDPATIEDWWRQWPDANIGVATGAMSGVFVLDVDAGADGFETLAVLEDTHGRLPETPTALTGGGGEHRYFRWLAGYTVRNSAGRLGPGLDIRGEGGYVAVAPSVHPNGQRYEWLDGQYPWSQTLADAPDWLLQLVAQPDRPAQAQPPSGGNGRIPTGRRNSTLTSIAGSLRRKGLDAPAIVAALKAINVAECDEPLPADEIHTIANSVARYEPEADQEDVPAVRDYHYAELLAKLFEGRLRWYVERGRWLRWDGTRWAEAIEAEVEREASEALRLHLAAHIATTADRHRLAELGRQVAEVCTHSRITGALAFLKGWPGVTTRAHQLDADPWLLNVRNGTIDLRSGALRPHKPDDLLTKRGEVDYDGGQTSGAWQRHIELVLPNPAIRREVQRSLGLALVGAHLDERLDIWHGSGANGKSTTITALLKLLGDYAVRAAPDLLVKTKYDRHPTEIADLQGRRLVFSVEVEQGKHLAEALVKDLTGGDRLKARFMRQDFFEFSATFNLFLACNARPVVSGGDYAIWRRIRLIPWEVTIPPELRRPQEAVIAELVADGPAVLRWLLEGLADWQRDPNWTAAEVQAATQEYRAEQDVLGAFLAERCETGPRYTVSVAELYDAYCGWTTIIGEDPVKKSTFGRLLKQRGFGQKEDGHKNQRRWEGLRLRANASMCSVSPPKNDSWGGYTENLLASARTDSSNIDSDIPPDWRVYLEENL